MSHKCCDHRNFAFRLEAGITALRLLLPGVLKVPPCCETGSPQFRWRALSSREWKMTDYHTVTVSKFIT